MRLLVHQECLKNGVWVLLVQVILCHFQQTIAFVKMIVQTPHFNANVAALRLQIRFDVEHQNLVQLRHSLGSPVVLTHQHFTGALGVLALWCTFGLIPKTFGQCMLQIKNQAIFSTFGQQMKPCADEA